MPIVEEVLLLLVEAAIGLPIFSLPVSLFLYLLLVQFDFSGPTFASAVGLDPLNAIKIVALPIFLAIRAETGHWQEVKRPSRLVLSWLLFGAYATLAVAWSPVPLAAVKQIGYLASFFLLAVVARRVAEDDLQQFGRLVLAAAVASLFIAILQTYVVGNPFGWLEARLTTFSPPNYFAVWIVFTVVLVLWLSLRTRTIFRRWAGPVLGVGLGSALVANNSRTELISLGMVLVLLVLLALVSQPSTFKQPLKIAAGCGIGALVCLVIILAWPQKPGPSKSRGKKSRLIALGEMATRLPSKNGLARSPVPGNLEFRLTRYRRALDDLRQRGPVQLVFGRGTSSAVKIVKVTDLARWRGNAKMIDANRVVHDAPLRVLFEWGILGFVFFLWVLLELGRLLWRCNDSIRAPAGRVLVLGGVPLCFWVLLGNPLASSGSPAGAALALWIAAVIAVSSKGPETIEREYDRGVQDVAKGYSHLNFREGLLGSFIDSHLRRRWFSLRVRLGCQRGYLLDVLKLRRKYRRRIVSKSSDLVIEGFPRSANTFAVAAVTLGCSASLEIASHTHLPAQVVRGVKLGVPVLVLVRQPEDAVGSLMLRIPYLSLVVCLRYYCDFHRCIYPFRDAYVVATFEQAVSDFGSVMERMNERFGVHLPTYGSRPEEIQACFEMIERNEARMGLARLALARPNEQKARARQPYLETLHDDPNLQVVHQRAAQWYQRFQLYAGGSQ